MRRKSSAVASFLLDRRGPSLITSSFFSPLKPCNVFNDLTLVELRRCPTALPPMAPNAPEDVDGSRILGVRL